MPTMVQRAFVVALLGQVGWTLAYDNGVARTPPMGWNSWNHFHSGVSAEVLATTTDTFVNAGLRDAGYVFINTDDCWSELGRDNVTGRIVPGKNFGGNGAAMKNLSAYIRSKGMKFGIYGAAGQTTCAGRAGGLYHEYLDAATYADWGADYLKYDDCGQNNINSYAKFSAMRDALNRTGRPMVFSYEPHLTQPIEWTRFVGNAWRTGGDIGSSFGSVFHEVLIGNAWASLGGPGNFNDMDMLEVGNAGLTFAEQRTHFAIWCLAKSPLLIGSDVRSIATDSLELLKNAELIAINQDQLGVQAAVTAVYDGAGRNLLLDVATAAAAHHAAKAPSTVEGERRAAEAARRRAFGTNSSAMTTCDYVVGPAPPPQQWEFVRSAAGATMIRSKDGASCLSSGGPGIVPCGQCKTDCDWDTASGYSGENGNRGRANETTAQIKSKIDGRCLKFSAASRGGKGLYMEACNTDPANCVAHRCFYSANLGDEEWYLADNGQLIASFVRGDGHQVPPLSFMAKQERSTAAAAFNGPVAGLGNDGAGGSLDRCGNMRGASDMGTTPMCKGTTSDGKLVISLAEVERRCAADDACAGFSQDTKDGPSYFRPQQKITAIGADPKWTTWTKGPLPPAPSPHPSPPPGPAPNDWYDAVDVPFCLASAPSSSPPKEPSKPPAITASLSCNEATPTLVVVAGPLSGGGIAVGLSNKCSGNHTITATFKDIGAAAGTTYKVRDAVNHVDLADATDHVSAMVGEHDIAVLRLEPK